MKIEWKNLITCIAIPLAVGALSSLLTKNSMENFAMLQKPTFAPVSYTHLSPTSSIPPSIARSIASV